MFFYYTIKLFNLQSFPIFFTHNLHKSYICIYITDNFKAKTIYFFIPGQKTRISLLSLKINKFKLIYAFGFDKLKIYQSIYIIYHILKIILSKILQ